jgi:hypothetical protein
MLEESADVSEPHGSDVHKHDEEMRWTSIAPVGHVGGGGYSEEESSRSRGGSEVSNQAASPVSGIGALSQPPTFSSPISAHSEQASPAATATAENVQVRVLLCEACDAPLAKEAGKKLHVCHHWSSSLLSMLCVTQACLTVAASLHVVVTCLRIDVFQVPGAEGTIGAYVNPHGAVHQTLTIKQVI